MITAVVTFQVSKDMTREKALETFKGASVRFQNVPGLIRKQFLYDGDKSIAGGVYLWESRAAAEACYQGVWKDNIRKVALSEPDVAWFETPVVVDNETHEVKTAA